MRLASSGWSMIILVAISMAYGESRSYALAVFFSTSLIATVTSGFSSFTLARYKKNTIQLKYLTTLVISSLCIFTLINLYLSIQGANYKVLIISIIFLLRETISYKIRFYSSNLSVFVRDHCWRIILIIFLIALYYSGDEIKFIDLFFQASLLAAVLEILLYFGFIDKINKSHVLIDSRSEKTRITSFFIVDFLGKMQSGSLAIIAIIITSNIHLYDVKLVAFFMISERASRPIGLIISQANLELQNERFFSSSISEFLSHYFKKRRLFIIFGVISFPLLILFFCQLYNINFMAASGVVIIYQLYIVFHNIINTYTAFKFSKVLIAVRAISTYTFVSLLLAMNITNIAIILSLFVFFLIFIDLLNYGHQRMGT